ncbi:MAG TPA: FecR domain-containing protein [Actinomycetota bacterium]|nr:FecR domain-containing protein [Micrococcales bacterium]HPE12909.1 FecR domain-containing protein [Actinomycetota bacterium]HPJ18758.1 FecR domain-containing protein [Actinomycetota bacterium]HPQ84946.1 FecR domain-containing protein [Actinomycetota bacterium]
MIARSHHFTLSILLTFGLLVALCLTPSAAAAQKWVPPKKTTTYSVTIHIDGRTVVAPFVSTETVTAEILANPVGNTDDPSAWTGSATLNFGSIVNTGLPQGCELMTTPPTGTTQVAITKQGEDINVVWSTSVNPLVPSVLICKGYPAPYEGAPAVEPTAFLEPREFTLPAAGGSKSVYGQLSTGTGMMENSGTITVTRRVECGQKVKQVNTYPPGQQTSLGSKVGKGFAAGEKVTADTNVEFVFEDGSVVRLAKGSSIKEDKNCEAFRDKSRSFKGTLLLGLIWAKVSAVFGDQVIELPRERSVTGRRGTTFWIVPHKKFTTLTVSKGSMWLSRTAKDKLTGKVFVVKKGKTAVITKKRITVRKALPKDAFPFGGKSK